MCSGGAHTYVNSTFVASAPAGRRVAWSFLGRHTRTTYPDPPTFPASRKTPWLGRLEKRLSPFRPFTLHAVGTVGSTPHARLQQRSAIALACVPMAPRQRAARSVP